MSKDDIITPERMAKIGKEEDSITETYLFKVDGLEREVVVTYPKGSRPIFKISIHGEDEEEEERWSLEELLAEARA